MPDETNLFLPRKFVWIACHRLIFALGGTYNRAMADQLPEASQRFFIRPEWVDVLAALGISTAEDFFSHSGIEVWRKLPERENGVLRTSAGVLHVKRHQPGQTAPDPACAHLLRGRFMPQISPARAEIHALSLLQDARVPTLDIVAYGEAGDGRSFTASSDLSGYRSGQMLMRDQVPFAALSSATATLAAQLHNAGLHHRDLYLCHFFLPAGSSSAYANAKLIDIGRVRRLPAWTRTRWVVKDLAQFWYSAASEFNVPESELRHWLAEYNRHRGLLPETYLQAIQRKVKSIGRHDANLKNAAPTRNVSLPDAQPRSTAS